MFDGRRLKCNHINLCHLRHFLIAFVKHLFGESNEDYNRVMSQLNTFSTLDEAKSFLNEMVIPDYGYWVGKEEYIERFMEVLEKKFS